jgi:signal transduction histidine kinase
MLKRLCKLAVDLHPPQLSDFGLYSALRAHCRQQADSEGWTLHFSAPEGGKRPHGDVEVACFRVVEEALSNIARHGNASEVRVELSRAGDDLHLSVRDNGSGFNVTAIREHMEEGRLGLVGMEERVRQVGGHLEITSEPGKGSEIRAVFSQCDRAREDGTALRAA